MLTISEIAAIAVIWVLLSIGGFFGIRAVVRKKQLKKQITKNDSSLTN